MIKASIAIIGAGISGLTLAKELADQAKVTVFEKSRGVGGRMATRRLENPEGRDPESCFEFDHGTQFFTAKSAEFQNYLTPLIQRGLVAEWTGRVLVIEPGKSAEDRPWPDPHYVAVPAMNSLAKHLAQGLDIHLNTQVERLGERAENLWSITDTEGKPLGSFDWVITTAPPAQAVSLFAGHVLTPSPITEAQMQGCYTLMLGLNKPWREDWIAAKVRNSPLEWVAINSTKPGRDGARTAIVVHSSNNWAQNHIDEDQDQIKASLLNELSRLKESGLFERSFLDLDGPTPISMHRWRYALKPGGQSHKLAEPFSGSSTEPFVDPSLKLAAVGDWCSASRIEDVWLGALSLATTLRTYL